MAFLNWRYQGNALIQLTWRRFAEFRTGFGCPDRVLGGASSDDRGCGTQKASGNYSLILVL